MVLTAGLGTLIGTLASAALSTAGSALLGSSQLSQQRKNNDLQQYSLWLQNQQFEYQKQYDAWAKQFSENQDSFNRQAWQKEFGLASSPVSTVVNDGATVGVNPMASLGQSAGSASFSAMGSPSSNTSTGFGAGSVPLMDSGISSLFGLIGSLATTQMNNKTEKYIADKNASLRQQELDIIDENNKGNLFMRQQELEVKKIESAIKEKMANLDYKRFDHDSAMDLKKYLLEDAKFTYSKSYSEREFSQRVSEFNRKFDQMVAQLNAEVATADKDRRMQYITRFSGQVLRLLGSIFGRGSGSDLFVEPSRL